MIDDIGDTLDDFRREIIYHSRQKIREHIAAYPDNFKCQARIQFLKGEMQEIILETLYLMLDYDRLGSINEVNNRLYIGQKIKENINEILTLQAEIISLRQPKRQRAITDDMIRRAKEYPFADLHEFRRNQAVCPFHVDKDPSMHLFPDNHVYCFSCNRGWDTIAFIQERDGVSFQDAIKRLQ